MPTNRIAPPQIKNMTFSNMGDYAQGSWNPSYTGTSNLDATPSGAGLSYMRIGSTVFFNGTITVDPTTAGSTTTFRLTLPIPSNFTSGGDAVGTSARVSNGTEIGTIRADTTFDALEVNFTAAVNSSHNIGIFGWYTIN